MASSPRNGRIVPPEDARREQEDPHDVDDQRARDQERIAAPRLGGEPGVDARGELVQAVPHAARGESPRTDERLGPEPQPEPRRHREDAEHDRPDPLGPPRRFCRLTVHVTPPSRPVTARCVPAVDSQHRLEACADFLHERRRRRVARPDLDRLAHADRDGQRPVDGRHVGQVLLQPLDGLEDPFGARVPLEVAGGVEAELLRQVEQGELPPAAVALGVGQSPLHEVREDRRAEGPHPRRHVALPLLDGPLRLERAEDVVGQPRQPVVDRPLARTRRRARAP